MLKIDNTLLEEVGLGALPANEKNSFLKHIYETLEMRVGIRLADQMSNEQLDEFERYFEAKDDAGAFKWLETNFPNYKDIVQQEFDKLRAEVAQNAPQILAASQQAQAGQPQPQPVPPAQAQAVPQPQTQFQPAPQQAQPYQASPQPQYQPPPQPQPQPYQPPPAPQAPQPQQPPFPNQQPPAGPLS